MRLLVRLTLVALLFGACFARGNASSSSDWIALFDGRTLDGWRASEHPATFRVEHGEIVVNGPRAHLFYDGPATSTLAGDFELALEARTRPGANSGIYLRTAYQPSDWPSHGYEVQVNNSHTDWRRTGSLYGLQEVREAVPDDRWFTVHATVQGRRIRVHVDGRQTVDYTEPTGSATRLTGGTIALQGHDPDSEVRYRNVRVRRLAR